MASSASANLVPIGKRAVARLNPTEDRESASSFESYDPVKQATLDDCFKEIISNNNGKEIANAMGCGRLNCSYDQGFRPVIRFM